MQWSGPDAGHLVGRHAAPAVTAEVCLAADDAYRARAAARFQECERVPELNAINPPFQVPTMHFLLAPKLILWENCKDQQSTPCY